MKIVVHSIDEKEIPAEEALLEDSHLTKATSFAARAEEDGVRSLGFDKDRGGHLSAAAKLASNMSKEPVLRYAESRMLVECLDKEVSVPERNGAMWKGGTTDLACKCALNTRDFVFQILCLLTKRSFRRVGADGLDGVAHAHDLALQSI